jgi:hypothetical protein
MARNTRKHKKRLAKKILAKRKTHHKRRRSTRKMKGGMCYGNGVGSNNYEPNLSIYNTNMLKLFPYKA